MRLQHIGGLLTGAGTGGSLLSGVRAAGSGLVGGTGFVSLQIHLQETVTRYPARNALPQPLFLHQSSRFPNSVHLLLLWEAFLDPSVQAELGLLRSVRLITEL